MATTPLLEIKDLQVEFKVYGGVLKVLDGVEFRVDAGEKVGVKVTAHMLRHTYATQLLNAHYNDLGETHIVNVAQRGAVQDWPEDWVLEMPCRLDGTGDEDHLGHREHHLCRESDPF